MKNIWFVAANALTRRMKKLEASVQSHIQKWPQASFDTAVLLVFSPLAAAGMFMQGYPHDYPQFLRWHLTNIADVPYITATLNGVCGRFFQKDHPFKVASSLTAIGVFWEFKEAKLLGHSFDYVDAACYLAGLAAYVGAHKAVFRSYKPKLSQLKPPQP